MYIRLDSVEFSCRALVEAAKVSVETHHMPAETDDYLHVGRMKFITVIFLFCLYFTSHDTRLQVFL